MKFDLEERLIDYSVEVLEIIDLLPNNKGANHLGGQLVRSSTSPALNYAEAQAAESRQDFIHKMRVSLKELRESRVCMKIIKKRKYLHEDSKLGAALAETEELVAIFAKSIQTAQKNLPKER
ncbi:MAG TPA: four helix bundle protein [Chryseosolibacter sp.]